jgi:CubicO group peptidase (beta-lactamase class C family)
LGSARDRVPGPGPLNRANTGADVLGVPICRASGQSFEPFLRERIFDPLGVDRRGKPDRMAPSPARPRLSALPELRRISPLSP